MGERENEDGERINSYKELRVFQRAIDEDGNF